MERPDLDLSLGRITPAPQTTTCTSNHHCSSSLNGLHEKCIKLWGRKEEPGDYCLCMSFFFNFVYFRNFSGLLDTIWLSQLIAVC